MDLIPSPSHSVKIQIICGKVYLMSMLGDVNNFFVFKSADNAQQCFAFKPQANFHGHNLNFH
jgi:hypothetical protein